MKNVNHNRNPKERGIALFMAIFALLLLSAIAAGFMYLANTETAVNSNYRSSQQAYFASRAGLEEARARLVPGNANSIVAPTALPTLTNGQIIYIINSNGASDVVQPWVQPTAQNPNPYFDTTLCQAHLGDATFASYVTNEPPLAGVRCTTAPSGSTWYRQPVINSAFPGAGSTASVQYKWIRIMLKSNETAFPYKVVSPGTAAQNQQMVCYDSTLRAEQLLPAGNATCQAYNAMWRPVYVLTSMAQNPAGGRRITQMEVTQLTLPPPPGALTFAGPSPIFSPPSSAAFSVSGHDQRGRAKPGGADCWTDEASPRPAIGAFGAPSDGVLTADTTGRAGQYTGGGGTPSVQDVSSTGLNTLGSPYSTVGGLQSVVDSIKSVANSTYSSGATLPSPVSGITVVNGDASGDLSGSGILLVTGTLTLSGNPSFNGVILVIGKGQFIKNGGGNGDFRGGIIVANMYDSTNHLLPSGSIPGSPNVTWNGGGNASVCYDSAAISAPQTGFLYQLLAYSELPF